MMSVDGGLHRINAILTPFCETVVTPMIDHFVFFFKVVSISTKLYPRCVSLETDQFGTHLKIITDPRLTTL